MKRESGMGMNTLARIALSSLLAIPLVRAEEITRGEAVASFTQEFKPGEYVWHPEVSPAGPVVLRIILSEQVLHVYRNGVWIGSSTICSGKEGYRSPTGVFTILQKKVEHTSTIYTNMPMPYMQRLTWDGIAMHAGNLPGYPASHGCVRLPLDFAKKLYSVTSNGTTVVISDTSREKPNE
jgi:lipoprotein-anchoring transpeptidase ErfK/SrfK